MGRENDIGKKGYLYMAVVADRLAKYLMAPIITII